MATLNIKNLPDPIYDRLRARAREQRRSIAQEATHLLAQALDVSEPLSIMALRGLGKELWSEIEPARHVDDERAAWD